VREVGGSIPLTPTYKMKISLEKAKQNKLFYVVTNGVIYHPKKKKCLILQRSHKEIAHPGLWVL
jgi:hypothetical protein